MKDKAHESLRSAMLALLKLVIKLQSRELARNTSSVFLTPDELKQLEEMREQLGEAQDIGKTITDMNLKGDDKDGKECAGSKE